MQFLLFISVFALLRYFSGSEIPLLSIMVGRIKKEQLSENSCSDNFITNNFKLNLVTLVRGEPPFGIRHNEH